ncbi:MAG: flagellar FlbD family protein [Elusimicrobiota bacterium]
MIKLHKLNGQEIIINAELIESIEAAPDTILSLYTNNRFIVKENLEEVLRVILEYKKLCGQPNLPQMDFGRKK